MSGFGLLVRPVSFVRSSSKVHRLTDANSCVPTMPLIARKRALEPEAAGDAKIRGNSCVWRRVKRGVVGLSKGGARKSSVVVRNDYVKVARIGERDM